MALKAKRISSRRNVTTRLDGREETRYERRMRQMADQRAQSVEFGGYYSWGGSAEVGTVVEASGGYDAEGYYSGVAEYNDDGLPMGGYDDEGAYYEMVVYDDYGNPVYGGYEYKGILAPIGWLRNAWSWLTGGDDAPTADGEAADAEGGYYDDPRLRLR